MRLTPDPRRARTLGHSFQQSLPLDPEGAFCIACNLRANAFLNDPTPCPAVEQPEPQAPSEPSEETLTEAERLGLLVGTAYGTALADRDQARAMVADLLEAAEEVLSIDALDTLTWAGDQARADRLWSLVQAIRATGAVDSGQSPTQQED